MKPKYVLLLLILTAVLLSGCKWPGGAVNAPPGDLVPVSVISPTYHQIITDTTPTLWWSFEAVSYPYPQPYPTPAVAYDCSPDKFRISLSTGPSFADELGTDVAGEYNWTTPVLQSGKTYRWSIIAISDDVEGPPTYDPYHYFSVGEFCDELVAPVPLLPPDGSTVDTVEPTLYFDNPMTCLPTGYFLQYSKYPDFSDSTNIGHGLEVWDGVHIWLDLDNCSTYYWRVRAYRPAPIGNGPFSPTWSFKVQLPGTFCLDLGPIDQLIPNEIPSPPPDPSDRLWEVVLDSKCRQGPGTLYMQTGYLPKGHMAFILGRNEDGSWFKGLDPNGVECWGSSYAFNIPDDWQLLELMRYDPVPTAVPSATPTTVPPYDCSQHTDRTSCSAQNPVCSWDHNKGVCVNN